MTKNKCYCLGAAMTAAVFIIGSAKSMAATSTNSVSTQEEEVLYQPFDVKLEIGPTSGVGGSVGVRFMDHLGVSAGIDYWDVGTSGTIKDVNYNINLRFASFPITLDIYPWATSSFRISPGVVFNQNRLQGAGKPTPGSTVTLNGQTFNASAVGSLNLEVQQQPVNPYLGIGGNAYFDKNKHWSFGWEIGAMYTGDPRVSLVQSGSDGSVPQSQLNAAVAGERDKVKHYAKDAEVWPVIKLGIVYSF